jgi:hypothetical protein
MHTHMTQGPLYCSVSLMRCVLVQQYWLSNVPTQEYINATWTQKWETGIHKYKAFQQLMLSARIQAWKRRKKGCVLPYQSRQHSMFELLRLCVCMCRIQFGIYFCLWAALSVFSSVCTRRRPYGWHTHPLAFVRQTLCAAISLPSLV